MEMLADRLGQAAMPIRNNIGHALESASLGPVEGLVLSGETLGIADPQPEKFPKDVAADATDQQRRTHHDPIISATLHKQGIVQD